MATNKMKCQYWDKCYQKDPAHKKRFLHPDSVAADGDQADDATKKADSTDADGALEDISGTKVVFTGALAKQTRREAAAEAELYGVVPMLALSKQTDILVAGDGGGQKLERAKSLGVTIMTEEEWLGMLDNSKKTVIKPKPKLIPADDSDEDAKTKTGSPAKAGKKRGANHDISDSETEEDEEAASPAKKAKTNDDDDSADTAAAKKPKPKCRYWDKCYQRSPAHKKAFRHPGDKGAANEEEEDMEVVQEPAIPQPKNFMVDGEEVTVDGHRIKRVGDDYTCNCAGWKFQKSAVPKRSCRHLKSHLGLEYEARRIGETVTSSGRVSRPPVHLKHKNIGQLLLAHKWTESVNPKGWWISEKLDGVRAYWDGRTFYSRLGNEFRAPKWFTKAFPTDMTLDGELFGGRGKFQSTVSIVKTPESDQWKNIKYYVFDAPSVKQPFEKRMEQINEFFDENKVSTVHVVEQEVCRDVPHLNKELARVEGLGGEGLMIRKPKSHYEHGRSHSLLKIKTFHDAEALVTGHEKGKGRNSNVCGALVCQMECGKVFRVGSGLTDADRRKPPKKGTIITYKFQELTNSGVPRFPSYIGVRADADGPKDAVLPPKPTDG